jgi:hypothetical protein
MITPPVKSCEMSICIICREEKSEFSDEHVIPSAIGGFYHIYNVCKVCNSIMGSKIDSKLINHIFSKHLRFSKKMKGNSGELPNPFEGTHHLENDPSRKVYLIPDKESIIRPYVLPKINEEKINENEFRIHISVDDKDFNSVDEILRKKLKRLGMSKKQIVSKEIVEEKKKGLTIQTHNYFDLLEYKIGLLKIAYEFAVTTITDYFKDEMAFEISKILKNASYDQVIKYVNIGDGLTKDLLIPFIEYLDFKSDKHYLILLNNNGKLYCLLSIFYMFIVGIQLSNRPYLSELDVIIGINDYNKKTFDIYDFYDIINMNSKYSYTYALQFESEKDNLEFFEETKKESSPFYSNENGLLLFDRLGKNVLTDITSLLINFNSNRKAGEYIGQKIEIPVPGEHFVKLKVNGKTIKLIQIIEERTTIKF